MTHSSNITRFCGGDCKCENVLLRIRKYPIAYKCISSVNI